MADKKDDPKNDPVKKFVNNSELVKELIDSLSIQHSEAYVSAAKKHLWDKDKKRYVMSKLKDESVRNNFIKDMSDSYMNAALDYFDSKTKDDLKKHALVKSYGGMTQKMINQYVHTHQHKYSAKLHETLRDQLIKEVNNELLANSSAHLTEKDKVGLLKVINADKMVDPGMMRLEDALALYSINDGKPIASKDDILDFYRSHNMPAPVYLKSDKPVKKAA